MPGDTRRIPLSTPFGRQVGQRFSLRGPFLSALVHLGLIFLIVWGAKKSAEALSAGEGPGKGGGGGGGGNRMFTVMLPAAAAAQPKPPAPVVQPTTPQLVVPRVVKPLDSIPQTPAPSTTPATAPATGPGSGTGTGPGSGTGTGGGTGSGNGPGVGSGVGPDSGGGGGTLYLPQISTMLPPIFDHIPSNLRGKKIDVHFDIDVDGRVLGIDVEPPIQDRGFRNQMMEKLRGYTFTAALTREGHPVRATFTMHITL